MGKRKRAVRKPGDPMFGISRIDRGSTHCWYVRLYEDEDCYPKTFSDSKYGGKRKAQQAAKAWRDEVLAGIEARGGQRRKPGPTPALFGREA